MSIVEQMGPEAALVAPGEVDTTDFSKELESSAGLLLGSVNAFCRKAFGISPLEEIVKPIVGDWTQLEKARQAWLNAGEASKGVGTNFTSLPTQTADVWVGDSGDAFRSRMTSVGKSYNTYAEGCSLISRLSDALISVAKGAANVIAVVISFIGDLLTRLAVEASIPVLGWLAGGADVALHIKEFWDKMSRGYRAVERVLAAVKKFIEAMHLLAQILNVLALVEKGFATGLNLEAGRHIDGAAEKKFGVEA